MSNYLQGLRHKFDKLRLPIVVTDVQPGFVDTANDESGAEILGGRAGGGFKQNPGWRRRTFPLTL